GMIAAAKNARGPSLEEFKCNHEWALRDRLKCFVNLESVPWRPDNAGQGRMFRPFLSCSCRRATVAA
ncbi:MAG: hypothetical protein ABSC25_23985, partial [Roseiarcus sp.]